MGREDKQAEPIRGELLAVHPEGADAMSCGWGLCHLEPSAETLRQAALGQDWGTTGSTPVSCSLGIKPAVVRHTWGSLWPARMAGKCSWFHRRKQCGDP